MRVIPTKADRLTEYDASLLSLERAADRRGYAIDNDDLWKKMNQMVTDYQLGEVRHSPQFRNKFYALRRELGKRMGY